MSDNKRILLYGYGNPGRKDDGLGNAFIDVIEPWIKDQGFDNVILDSNYQLNIEDAHDIAENDIVIFVDASVESINDYIVTPVKASDAQIEFTMHAVSPSFVLDLCNKLYNKYPEAYLIHIKGYEWDFSEGLTTKAKQNLDKAVNYVKKVIKNPQLLTEISE